MEYDIKNGPNDAPYILQNPADTIEYDENDVAGPFYMLDRDYQGCIVLPLSKPVLPGSGRVTLGGEAVPYVVKLVQLTAELRVPMLGAKLAGRMGGGRAALEIGGFADEHGNVMDTQTFTVVAKAQAEPRACDAEHEAVALRAAQEGIVLMKNEGDALPVRDAVLSVLGDGLYGFASCAAGAGKINPRYHVGFRRAVGRDEHVRLNGELAAFALHHPGEAPGDEMLARAAKQSRTGIMILTRLSGENMDDSTAPGEYALTENERATLAAMGRHFARVVLVLNTGYPIAMDFLDEIRVDALVYCGFGGMMGGQALLDVLTGRVNPSGRLTDSWARRYEDIPASANFYDCAKNGMQRYTADNGPELTTRYDEGVMVGYRHFVTRGGRAAFPFGHGLSYTTFEETAGEAAFDERGGVRVTVSVRNTGGKAGRHVVQLYAAKPKTAVFKPARELIAFGKTKALAPGEAQTLELTAETALLGTFSQADSAYLLEAGEYALYLGENAQDVREIARFSVEETKVLRRVSVHMTGARTVPGYSDKPLHPAAQALSVKELIRLSVCAGDGWGMEGTGEAGRVAKVDALPMRDYVAADGNSGVNMKTPNIGMPSGACLASSFDAALMRDVGRVIGEEAKALGISVILAPGFNLHRHPLCGRNPEYFSEDPLLTGALAAAYAQGLESTGVHACYKHFAANNAEASRKRNDSVMDEETLRNLYLRAFEIAMMRRHPASVMTAYNKINGVYTSCDPELILGVLRGEWGFEGYVMTDWVSYDTADMADMVNAGVSFITPGSAGDSHTGRLEQAAREGRLDVHRLRENVSYLLDAIL